MTSMIRMASPERTVCWSPRTESPRRSPRTPVASYSVRNTFIEVHNQGDAVEEDLSQPLFRRRRGSSFWRCSSEPLHAPRVEQKQTIELDDTIHEENCEGGLCDHSLKSRRDSSDIAYLTTSANWKSSQDATARKLPQMPPGSFKIPTNDSSNALAAAMQAGFSAGLMAAMSLSGPNSGSAPVPVSRGTHLAPHSGLSTRSVQIHEAADQTRKPRGRQEAKLRATTPPGQYSSNVSEASTTIGSAASRTAPSPVPPMSSNLPCHLIWCDNRAFKETSGIQRQQLEHETNLPVKAHKSAENCIRLLRKKQNAQGRPPCVILVSWTNAGALLPYLNEATHVSVKVVVLRDSQKSRTQDTVEQLMLKYPCVERVVSSWPDAVHAVGMAAAEMQVAQW